MIPGSSRCNSAAIAAMCNDDIFVCTFMDSSGDFRVCIFVWLLLLSLLSFSVFREVWSIAPCCGNLYRKKKINIFGELFAIRLLVLGSVL